LTNQRLGTKVPKNVLEATMLVKVSASVAGGGGVPGFVTGVLLNKSEMLMVE
jgi:hypothetical protein